MVFIQRDYLTTNSHEPSKRLVFGIGLGIAIVVSVIILASPFLPIILYYVNPPIADPYFEEYVSTLKPILVSKEHRDEEATLTSQSNIASIGNAVSESIHTSKPEANTLVIPRIGVRIPIIESDNQSYALSRGSWLLPGTSIPSYGSNTVVSAHRFKYLPPYKETFYLLDKLEDGDVFNVYWEGKEYRYRVDSTRVISPDNLSVLNGTPEARFTLVTCNPLFSVKERLVVSGILIEVI